MVDTLEFKAWRNVKILIIETKFRTLWYILEYNIVTDEYNDISTYIYGTDQCITSNKIDILYLGCNVSNIVNMYNLSTNTVLVTCVVTFFYEKV